MYKSQFEKEVKRKLGNKEMGFFYDIKGTELKKNTFEKKFLGSEI